MSPKAVPPWEHTPGELKTVVTCSQSGQDGKGLLVCTVGAMPVNFDRSRCAGSKGSAGPGGPGDVYGYYGKCDGSWECRAMSHTQGDLGSCICPALGPWATQLPASSPHRRPQRGLPSPAAPPSVWGQRLPSVLLSLWLPWGSLGLAVPDRASPTLELVLPSAGPEGIVAARAGQEQKLNRLYPRMQMA